MFDLRPLLQDFNALAGAINPDLATLVFGIDILVMVPEGTPSTEIRLVGALRPDSRIRTNIVGPIARHKRRCGF